MAVEKKHTFKGLDLRTNILTREDGTAADCSNVYLDESRNLLKRKEMKKLEVPYGLDPETELYPGTTILEVIEFKDEILLFTHFKGEATAKGVFVIPPDYDAGPPPDLPPEYWDYDNLTWGTYTRMTEVNKLYRVTNLSTTPITIEEIPCQSTGTLAKHYQHSLGRVSPISPAIVGKVTWSIADSCLFIAGECTNEYSLRGSVYVKGSELSYGYRDTYPTSILIKYDGEVYHGASIPLHNISETKTTRTFTGSYDSSIDGDFWYSRAVMGVIDANGLQSYNAGPTYLTKSLESVVTLNQYYPTAVGCKGGSVTLHPDAHPAVAVNMGDNTLLYLHDTSNNGYGDPFPEILNSGVDINYSFSPNEGVLRCLTCDAAEGQWLLLPHRRFSTPARVRVKSIVADSPWDFQVTVEKPQMLIEGKWRDTKVLLGDAWRYSDEYSLPILSGVIGSFYFSTSPTVDFECAGTYYGSANASARTQQSRILGISFNIAPVVYLSVELKDNYLFYQELMGNNLLWNGVPHPTYLVKGPKLYSTSLGEPSTEETDTNWDYRTGFLPSPRLEDFYPETVTFITPPPLQVLNFYDRLMTHDGERIYVSSTQAIANVDQFEAFANLKADITGGGGRIQNIASTQDIVVINYESKTFIVGGDILSGNYSIKEVRGNSFGAVSPAASVDMAGLPLFVSRGGVFASSGQQTLIDIGSKIDKAIVGDHYKLGIQLEKTKVYLRKKDKKAYIYLEGTEGQTTLILDFLNEEWFKWDDFPIKGGILTIENKNSPLFEKLIGSDGKDIFIESDTYITGVDAFYKSNYLTANEPSLKKQWHKCVVFLVGSPATEIVFDSSEDWGKGESEADCRDTLVVADRYVVDLKSFAPSNSYSRSVNLESLGTNELLINGFQVTYDYAQDQVVDENEQ